MATWITRGAQDDVFDPVPYVYVKPTWDSLWEPVPFLYPLSAEHTLFHTIGQASFAYEFGNVQQPGRPLLQTWDYRTHPNYYIKIVLRTSYSRYLLNSWIGVIDHESVDVYGNPTYGNGVQTITAHSLEVLLNRYPVLGSFSWCGGDLYWSDLHLPFNEGSRRRTVGDSKSGNMAPVPLLTGEPYFYNALVGETPAVQWTNLDAAFYLLQFYPNDATGFWANEGPEWILSGDTALLEELVTTNDFNNMSVYEALRKLIDPNRGLMARTGTLPLVHSLSETGPIYIDIGSTLWGVNPNTTVVDMSDRRLTNTRIDFAHGETYDKVYVEGGNIYTCFSMTTDPDVVTAYGAAPLVPGWSATAEAAYLAITTATHGSQEACDRARKSEKFASVYRKFVVSDLWDGLIGGYYARPIGLVNGGIDWYTPTAVYSGRFKAEDEIPFLEEDAETSTEENLRPPFALGLIEEDVGGTPVQTYQYVESLTVRTAGGGDTPSSGAGSFDVLDKGLGITVRTPLAHIAAKTEMTDLDSTRHPPLWYWETIVTTVMVKWPSRIKVLVNVNVGGLYAASEVQRIRVVEDHDAEAIYVMPGTITDVDPTNPSLLLSVSSLTCFRDDSARLIEKAYRAAAWFQQQAASLSMPIEQIDMGWFPGILVLGANDGTGLTRVGTVSDSVRHDFQSGTTMITTARRDWADSDTADMNVGTPISGRNAGYDAWARIGANDWNAGQTENDWNYGMRAWNSGMRAWNA